MIQLWMFGFQDLRQTHDAFSVPEKTCITRIESLDTEDWRVMVEDEHGRNLKSIGHNMTVTSSLWLLIKENITSAAIEMFLAFTKNGDGSWVSH